MNTDLTFKEQISATSKTQSLNHITSLPNELQLYLKHCENPGERVKATKD